ncbi:hypothetical protein [Micromonospora sp. NPDC007230]|uniref:hypothetical protein n=1 Tax=Micromonospora sp. NPDC007230 TaxID=3364237 RepID=UPI0036B0689D
MNANDWVEVVGAIGLFALVITVVTVVIVQVATTLRARATLSRETEYKTLAQTVAQAQENTERHLAELGQRLAAMESRMASLERLLKEVE